MYQKLFFVFLFFSFWARGWSQLSGRIAYVDMDYILEHLEEYQRASNLLEQRTIKWKNDIQKQQDNITQLRNRLNHESLLLTKELIEEYEEEIHFYEQKLTKYQKQRFGPKGDYEIQQATLVQPIQDIIFDIIGEIAEIKRYDIVLNSSEVSVIFVSKRINISDDVLKRIKRRNR